MKLATLPNPLCRYTAVGSQSVRLHVYWRLESAVSSGMWQRRGAGHLAALQMLSEAGKAVVKR